MRTITVAHQLPKPYYNEHSSVSFWVEQVNKVVYDEICLNLRRPVELIYRYDRHDHLWECKALGLTIEGFGASRQEAFDDFCLYFVLKWEHIANVPDDELHQSALQLKQSMRGLVVENESESNAYQNYGFEGPARAERVHTAGWETKAHNLHLIRR